MTLIGLIVVVIILGLIYYLVNQLPIAQPFKTVILVIFILILILLALQILGLNLGTNIRLRN